MSRLIAAVPIMPQQREHPGDRQQWFGCKVLVICFRMRVRNVGASHFR
jgi:hypothetical protein